MASKNNKQNTLKIYIAAVFAVFVSQDKSFQNTIKRNRKR